MDTIPNGYNSVPPIQACSEWLRYSISPGSVDTDMLRDALPDDAELPPALKGEDIAGAVIFALGAPKHVQSSAVSCELSVSTKEAMGLL
ncbi:unnamed protein product [Timema podura]|uniref:Uncharacterized protein n=1 Tax=Timema podura TaxID=61482 RepID=A0ABN7PAY3_TIMPD|nr:unnamed protein product [Timema podura]